MSQPAAWFRRWRNYGLIAAGIGLIAILAVAWYTTTQSFQEYARRRLVAEIERITGGHAQVGSFHIVPLHTQVELRDITVHGTEGADQLPLAHADHLIAHLKVISLLRSQFGFHSVTLERPVVHIAIAADGTTNIPESRALLETRQEPALDKLFALSIDHLSIRNGDLFWADQEIPLDFTVEGMSLQMDYSYLRGRYESHLSLGKVDTAYDGWRPFSWMTSADFSLAPKFVEIRSLSWNSGRSHLKVDGQVSDFRHPQLDGHYTASVDLEEAGAIARRRDLRGGFAEAHGSGHWSIDQFSSIGSLSLRDVSFQNDQVFITKAAATADYSLTDQQIKVSKLQGKLLSGTVLGEAQIDNWLHSIGPAKMVAKQRPLREKNQESLPQITATRAPGAGGSQKIPGVQSGSIRLRLQGISAADVASALSVPAHPLGRFHPVGSAAGTVEANWKGSPEDAEISFGVDVSPSTSLRAGDLPITAHLQGKYHTANDTLDLAQFNVSTPSSRIQAAGTLSSVSTVHFSVSTSNLEEWRPLVTALGGPTNVPFRIDGNAGFTGVAGGTLSSPALAGTLLAQDFEFSLPATARTPQQEVHWDSLAASIQFSSHELLLRGGSLQRGETTADFDVSADLRHGHFTENSPYTARVNLHHVDVASTAALAGFDYPVTGTANVSLQISGTRSNPQVQGHIRATDATAYTESIGSFDADLHIVQGETSLNNIHLTHQDAVITGNAAYTPATQGLLVDLTGSNFDLARIRQIHLNRLLVEGRGDFTVKGSGTLSAPVIQANVHVRNLTLDHELAGGLNLQAVTQRGVLHVTGTSEFVHGGMTLEGDVEMRDAYPGKISARLDHVDLDALWRSYLDGRLTGHSSVAGTVTMQGPLRYPRQWTLAGDLNEVNIEPEYAKLHNEGPVRFAFAQGTLHIDPLHMVGVGTDVTGHGSIGFSGAEDLDLAADGQIDLKLLGSFDSDITASGLMNVHMTVRGSLHQPLPQGTVLVKNGNVNYAGLPSGLSEMNGSLTFTRSRMHIETLTAKTGGGTLDFKGDASDFNGQLSFNLTAAAKDVRLRYPPGVSSTANAELHWVGSPAGSTISGNILVTKLAVTPGFDFGSYLESSRQTVSLVRANSPLYKVKLDIAVRTSPELQMKTAVARLSGDADLRLRGSLASPSVLGRADILEGDATFNGIKFQLERGDITFANPVSIEPQVNLQATTHVRNYDLDVTVTGTPDHLTINYRSEPPLPKSDIIALLALGRTSEESEQLQQQSGQTPFSDEATAMIINQAINSTVSSRLQKLFGVSRIKIDPQGLTTETNAIARGPEITIEQQFANNLSLTYSTNVSQSSQQIIQVEYFFTRNVSVVGTRDQNGVVSFDVRIRRRKK
ncbi:MAG TPA: translocation/assembly module TamB domain-containing protein [Verrucomicrobiae bacterium]|nr:translocation/assembly module TamB domain-containing protein [Verrucomicrobiae bacterium]